MIAGLKQGGGKGLEITEADVGGLKWMSVSGWPKLSECDRPFLTTLSSGAVATVGNPATVRSIRMSGNGAVAVDWPLLLVPAKSECLRFDIIIESFIVFRSSW